MQQHFINHAKHRSSSADSKRQSDYRNRSEARALYHLAQSVTEILD
jgi:hypothetical protein